MRLNLGCGYRILEGYENIDNRAEVGPDRVLDLSKSWPYPDSSIDEIRAFDFLEHIAPDDVIFLIESIWEALKPGGLFHSFTPSTEGRGAFQDPTHRSFWNMNSWLYYTHPEYRKLIGTKACFRGEVRDVLTDKEMNVIHTEAKLYAVK